jgi:MoaA/NifB/PqqE/SkfB family radical SAM enzyme
MIIRIKGIFHERTEDAPFTGALICAVNCNNNCKNCFNQYLKSEPIIEIEDKKIIKEVLSNPFNKGIIFGGLEWSLQLDELLQLIKLAKENNLEVMIYTGLPEEIFKSKFSEIYSIPNIYIKTGRYEEKYKCSDNVQHGVRLASSNQKIIKTKENT